MVCFRCVSFVYVVPGLRVAIPIVVTVAKGGQQLLALFLCHVDGLHGEVHDPHHPAQVRCRRDAAAH